MADSVDNWSLYPYDPSKSLPIIFAVLISILGVLNVYQNFIRYNWMRFGFIMTWASSIWVAAFILRSISVKDVQNVNVFIAQYVLVLVGPPLYAAAESFLLGRILAFLPYHTPIHPGRVVSTYFFISVIVEVLVNTGAANSAGRFDPSDAELVAIGTGMLKAGFILQCLLETSFMSLTALIHYRAHKAHTLPKNIRIMIYMIYLTSSMMLVRTIVRTIEGFEKAECQPSPDNPLGYCGYVSTHEWILWVFECANVTLFVCFLTWFTPGAYLPKSHRIFLDPIDGKTKRLGPGFQAAQKRSLVASVIDPFNMHGIVTGHGHEMDKFWEKQWPEYQGQTVSNDDQDLEMGFSGKLWKFSAKK